LRPSLSFSFFPTPSIGAVRLNFLFARLNPLIGEFVAVTPLKTCLDEARDEVAGKDGADLEGEFE